MAEYDGINISNPTGSKFTWKYNGEDYSVEAGETKPFSKAVGFHLAKHLSTQMLEEGNPVLRKKNATQQELSLDAIRHAQLTMYDNPKRRIALYDILGDVSLVAELLASYPFKAFIGDMKEYEEYVNKKTEKKKEPVVTKEK